MTVQDQTITSGPYSGNDVADTFDYSFQIYEKNELIAIETDDEGVETVLNVDTDYTVNAVGQEGGGSITRIAGPLPTDYSLFLRSNFLPTQTTDFDNQGAFFPENHEFALDKLTRLIQQLAYADEVTLMFSEDTFLTNFNPQLPAPDVALGYLRLNADLTGMEWVTNSGGIDLSQDFNFLGALQANGNDVYHAGNIAVAAVAPVEESGTAITVLPTHQTAGIVTTNASAVTITVENNATQALPVGAVIPIYQSNTGQVTFAEGAGVTIEYRASEGLNISEQFAFATLWQRATDTWVLSGSLAA